MRSQEVDSNTVAGGEPPSAPNVPSARAGRLLVLQVAGGDFALPLEAVREILPIPELSVPPGLPATLAGFLTLEGESIPVVHLARVLEVPETPPSLYTPLILLREEGRPAAVLADSVREILPVEEGVIVAAPGARPWHPLIERQILTGTRPVHLLSAKRILSAAWGLLPSAQEGTPPGTGAPRGLAGAGQTGGT